MDGLVVSEVKVLVTDGVSPGLVGSVEIGGFLVLVFIQYVCCPCVNPIVTLDVVFSTVRILLFIVHRGFCRLMFAVVSPALFCDTVVSAASGGCCLHSISCSCRFYLRLPAFAAP